MKGSPLVVVIAGLSGLALGGGAATWLSDATPRARPDGPRRPDTAPAASATGSSELAEPTRQPANEAAEAHDDEGAVSRELERSAEPESLFGPPLRAYAEAELARGWAEIRSDSMPPERFAYLVDSYIENLRITPAAWGRDEANAKNEDEGKAPVAETSDGGDWREMTDEARRALAADPARFAEIFRPRVSGRVHDGPTLAVGAPLADGDVLRYPAGVFRVRDLAQGREPSPADVTLRGAGMDATLLVLDELDPRGALERFAIENCTVFAEQGIADVRGAIVALSRIRLVGFDCGSGGSCALSLDRDAAVSAADCRFEGGYGRAPVFATLMNTSPLIARFESCSFERVSLLFAVSRGVVFASCSMNEMLWEQSEGPAYLSCRYSALPAEQRLDENLRRDLDQLFPGWRAELDAR